MLNALLPRSLPRRLLTLCVSLAATTAALLAQNPSAYDGFDPNLDGNVYAVAVQLDGKIVVGGQFSAVRPNGTVTPVIRNNLARFNPDGSLDASFNPNPNGPVRALAVQPDGSIVIGGDFTSLQPGGTGTAVTRSLIARVTSAGALDTSFSTSIGGGLIPQVYALVLAPGGAIVVGGQFTTVTAPALGSAQPVVSSRRNLVRLTQGGSVDTTWDPNPNGIVLALALHANNKLIVGGGFTTFQENGRTAVTTRNRIARLNADGTTDSDFNPNANNGVTAIAVQPDGKILLGGYFTTLQSPDWSTAVSRDHVARLETDGRIDAAFESHAAGNVAAIAIQQDGGILIGGAFTALWSKGSSTVSRSFVARFLPDGTVDGAFNAGLNSQVAALAIQSDGKAVVGGYFTRAFPANAPASAQIRNRLARISPNGAIDSTFQLIESGRPLVSLSQPDGKVIVGGSFTSIGGATHNSLARLNADGTVDAGYAPNIDGRVLALALQSDGKLLIGGLFTMVNSVTRNHLARLNADGTLDTSFDPNVDGTVGVIALQSDGRILVGGQFNSLTPAGATTQTFRSHIVRLSSAGAIDTAFDPSADNTVTSIIVQSDGKIVLGGAFTSFAPNGATLSVARGHIARINADGSLDSTFNPSLDNQVSAMVLQSDGKFVVGGLFSRILPAGATTPIDRHHLLRLNADGTLDPAYDPNANNNVLALALQSDGKLLVGGTFTTFTPNGADALQWILRKYAARLNTDGTVDGTFNLDLNEEPGNRVDSIRVLSDGRILIGGNFVSLQPTGTATRVLRQNFARLLVTPSVAVDTGFSVSAGGTASATVNAFALQSDGKIVVVGQFADLGGAKTANIARFTGEGAADPAFGTNLSTDDAVRAVAIRPNAANASAQLGGFAWVNANGTLRTAFAPGSNVRLSGQIRAIAFQSDGSVLLGGTFANTANNTSTNLLRFSASGALDPNFNPVVNGQVMTIAVQSDGKILIGGAFTLVNTVTRNRIARLNADGSLDTGYDPNASGLVRKIVLQSDGKSVIAGEFTTVAPNAATTATSRLYVARINTDGTVDTAYNPSPAAPVYAMVLQSDGKVVIGGLFNGLTPGAVSTVTVRNYLARINTDGTVDSAFDPNFNGAIYALQLQANGDILVGGQFTSYEPSVNGAKVTGFPGTNLTRIHADGSPDRNFFPVANAAVTTLAVQPNGQIVLGGDFTTVTSNGTSTAVARNHLARLGSDGVLDVAFNPDVSGSVFTVATASDNSVLIGGDFTSLQGTGRLIVGGAFTTVGGVGAPYLAIVNDDGTVNSGFLPAPNGAVNAVLTLSDGSFLVGGNFTSIAGAARNGVARFNASGALDASFNPAAVGSVLAIALQSDGKILVGNSGVLVRLNADGSRDAGFATSSATTGTRRIAVQPDGRIVYATLTSLSRLNANGGADATFTGYGVDFGLSIRDFTLQSDGRIIVSGGGLARLNSNGSVDLSFSPSPNGAVNALALQSDGRLMIGGTFTAVGGVPRVALARLAPTSASGNTLGVSADRTAVVWSQGGGSAEPYGVTFEFSADATNWTALGAGVRATDAFVRSGLSLPATGNFYIRVRGLVPSSAGTSVGIYEMVRQFNFAAPTFTPILQLPLYLPEGQGSTMPVGFFGVNPFTGFIINYLPSPLNPVAVIPGTTTPPTGGAAQPPSIASARLANISTRGRVSVDAPIILGFAINGTSSQTMLLRAVGPSLARFGVDGVATRPLLRLFDSDGHMLLENGSWTTSAGTAEAAVRTGAFAFDAGSTDDAAAVVTLAPGTYSMHVLTRDGTSGIALAEIYDAGTDAQTTSSRLVNLSSRGTAGVGGEALIGGLVISGAADKTLLVRGIGPTLARYGVTGTLADPVVSVYDAQNHLVASNDNWSIVSTEGLPSANTAAMIATTAESGAFSLDLGSKDAALSVTLAPGAYTIQVSGADGSAGAAMIEVYGK